MLWIMGITLLFIGSYKVNITNIIIYLNNIGNKKWKI